jgi:hypothetical protein
MCSISKNCILGVHLILALAPPLPPPLSLSLSPPLPLSLSLLQIVLICLFWLSIVRSFLRLISSLQF